MSTVSYVIGKIDGTGSTAKLSAESVGEFLRQSGEKKSAFAPVHMPQIGNGNTATATCSSRPARGVLAFLKGKSTLSVLLPVSSDVDHAEIEKYTKAIDTLQDICGKEYHGHKINDTLNSSCLVATHLIENAAPDAPSAESAYPLGWSEKLKARGHFVAHVFTVYKQENDQLVPVTLADVVSTDGVSSKCAEQFEVAGQKNYQTLPNNVLGRLTNLSELRAMYQSKIDSHNLRKSETKKQFTELFSF